MKTNIVPIVTSCRWLKACATWCVLGASLATAQTETFPIARAPLPNSASAQSTQLTTAAMIGPLQGTDHIFLNLRTASALQFPPIAAQPGVRQVPAHSGELAEWFGSDYCWANTYLTHKPLYFEQVRLERYGIGPKPVAQPLWSAAHFYGSIAAIPAKMILQHPGSKVPAAEHIRADRYFPRSSPAAAHTARSADLFR